MEAIRMDPGLGSGSYEMSITPIKPTRRDLDLKGGEESGMINQPARGIFVPE